MRLRQWRQTQRRQRYQKLRSDAVAAQKQSGTEWEIPLAVAGEKSHEARERSRWGGREHRGRRAGPSYPSPIYDERAPSAQAVQAVSFPAHI